MALWKFLISEMHFTSNFQKWLRKKYMNPALFKGTCLDYNGVFSSPRSLNPLEMTDLWSPRKEQLSSALVDDPCLLLVWRGIPKSWLFILAFICWSHRLHCTISGPEVLIIDLFWTKIPFQPRFCNEWTKPICCFGLYFHDTILAFWTHR